MKPVEFKDQNIVMHKPANMTDAECGALPSKKSMYLEKYPQFESVWELEAGDEEKLRQSKRIRLMIVGSGMPPVGLSVEEPEENRDTRQATGVELIAMERQEQISKHGYHSAHDWGHHHGELRLVAAILATNGTNSKVVSDYGGDFQSGLNVWGLENKLTGDQNKIHRLQVAGALIAAEIDRLQAIENAASEQVEVFYIGEDEFSRKCYKAKDGRIYADVEGDGILYSTTSEGEPIEPVNNVKIIG